LGYADFLRKVPLFAEASRRGPEAALLDDHEVTSTLAPGETLFAEGRHRA
jgi:hypothetical protein